MCRFQDATNRCFVEGGKDGWAFVINWFVITAFVINWFVISVYDHVIMRATLKKIKSPPSVVTKVGLIDGRDLKLFRARPIRTGASGGLVGQLALIIKPLSKLNHHHAVYSNPGSTFCTFVRLIHVLHLTFILQDIFLHIPLCHTRLFRKSVYSVF